MVSNDGHIVAIGALGSNGTYSGHDVRVHKYNSSTNKWSQLGQDLDGEAVSDQSGESVSLSSDGHVVAVAAPDNGAYYLPDDTLFDDDVGYSPGIGWLVGVHEYDSSTDTWIQLGHDLYGEVEDDSSGVSISLNRSTFRISYISLSCCRYRGFLTTFTMLFIRKFSYTCLS